MSTESTMVNELLSYLYGSFLITYVLCVIGSLIRDVMNVSKKKSRIHIKSILISSILVTSIICAIGNRYTIDFSIYVLLCLLGGACSGSICNLVMNNKLLLILTKVIGKNIKDPVAKIISDTVEEMDKLEAESKQSENENQEDSKKEEPV